MQKNTLIFEDFVSKYQRRLKGTFIMEGNTKAISYIIHEIAACLTFSFNLYEAQTIIKSRAIQEYGEEWYPANAEAINFIIEDEYADYSGQEPPLDTRLLSKEEFASYIECKELLLNNCPSCGGKAKVVGVYATKNGVIIDCVGCQECHLFVERELKLSNEPNKLFSKRTKSVVDVMKVWNSLTKQEL